MHISYSDVNLKFKFIIYSLSTFICCETFWSFYPTNVGQFWKSMTVLKSAHPEDSKTPPESWIWWRFGWDIEARTQPLFQLLLLILGLENFVEKWLVFYLQYLSQIFIKFNFQREFRNPQDLQISKLTIHLSWAP